MIATPSPISKIWAAPARLPADAAFVKRIEKLLGDQLGFSDRAVTEAISILRKLKPFRLFIRAFNNMIETNIGVYRPPPPHPTAIQIDELHKCLQSCLKNGG